MEFTVAEHYNTTFVFEATSVPVQLILSSKLYRHFKIYYLIPYYKGCSSNMYGGFNGSVCQPCPLNSTNEGGYSILSCECEAGYSGPNGGPCTGKY